MAFTSQFGALAAGTRGASATVPQVREASAPSVVAVWSPRAHVEQDSPTTGGTGAGQLPHGPPVKPQKNACNEEGTAVDDTCTVVEGITVFVKKGSFVIDPRCKQFLQWTGLLLVATLMACVVTPIQVAWYPDGEGAPSAKHFLSGFDTFITVVFFLDILINLNTAFVDDEDGVLVCDRKEICFAYLKFWFWIDLIATVQVSWFSGKGSASILRLLKLLRLSRLIRLLTSQRILRQMEADRALNYDGMALVKFLMLLLLQTHLMGCGLFIISSVAQDTVGFAEDNGVDTSTVFNQWLYGFYWAAMTVSTIGYGDVGLHNNSLRGYAVICMIIGASTYAYMVGALIGVLLNMDKQEQARRSMLSDVNRLMRNVGLPHEDKCLVRKFFSKTNAGEAEYLSDHYAYLGRLSPPLGATLVRHMHRHWLPHVWWLRSDQDNFTVKLAFCIREQSFGPGETIFRPDDDAVTMYVIRSGLVDLKGPLGSFLAGMVFGREILFRRPTTYGYTAVANGYVDLWHLERNELLALLQAFPKMQALSRMAEILLYIRKQGGVFALHRVLRRQEETRASGRSPAGKLATDAQLNGIGGPTSAPTHTVRCDGRPRLHQRDSNSSISRSTSGPAWQTPSGTPAGSEPITSLLRLQLHLDARLDKVEALVRQLSQLGPAE